MHAPTLLLLITSVAASLASGASFPLQKKATLFGASPSIPFCCTRSEADYDQGAEALYLDKCMCKERRERMLRSEKKTPDPLAPGIQTAHTLTGDHCPQGQSRHCCTPAFGGVAVRTFSHVSSLSHLLTGLKSADNKVGSAAQSAYYDCGGS
jgi:hypothetical protein